MNPAKWQTRQDGQHRKKKEEKNNLERAREVWEDRSIPWITSPLIRSISVTPVNRKTT